jgi:type I restriction enzyme R subunit
MFYESDVERTIIELLQDKGYSYIDDANNWVVERQLSDFINEELLLQQLT